MQSSRALSQSLAVVVIAWIIYAAVGTLLYLVIPNAGPEIAAAVQAMIPLSVPAPEPKENYTFLGLIVLTPLMIVASVVLHRRWIPRARLSGMLVYILLFLALFSFIPYESWPGGLALQTAWPISVPIFLGFLAVAYIHATHPRWQPAILRLVQGATLVALVLGAALNIVWRVFDQHTVIDYPSFTVHFDAITYSIAQIANGGTCLVDVVPQYGCHGELMAPIFAIFGLSVLSVTATFAGLQLLSMLALMDAMRRLVSNPVLLLASVIALVFVLDRTWGHPLDPNYQNMPIRLVFPALAIWAGTVWRQHPSLAGCFLLGVLGGTAIIWNLDSGAVVLGALGLLVAFTGVTREGWRPQDLLGRLLHGAVLLAGAALALFVFYAWLMVKSGTWPSLMEYMVYQRIFFSSGAFSMPIRSAPSLWHFLVLLAIAALAVLGNHARKGPEDGRLEVMAFLAVLAIGLFSYFVSRSHSTVLGMVVWPFVPPFFALIDRAWPRLLGARPLAKGIGVVLVSGVMAILLGALATVGPRDVAEAAKRISYAQGTASNAGGVTPQIEFLKDRTEPGDRAAILAVNQSTLFAETGLLSSIRGSGLVETLLQEDQARQLSQILEGNLEPLYLGYTLCCEPQGGPVAAWIGMALPQIRERYALAEWDPSGVLMRLEPRARGGRDLFAVGDDQSDIAFGVRQDPVTGESYGRHGRPLQMPRSWKVRLGQNFKIVQRFSLSKDQPPAATILSNRVAEGGFSIEQTAPGMFQLFAGGEETVLTGPPFEIGPDVEHRLDLSVVDGRMTVMLDGKLVFDSGDARVAQSPNRLTVGGSEFVERELSGRLIEFQATGDIIPL